MRATDARGWGVGKQGRMASVNTYMHDSQPPVIIVGAGMAGLACARDLHAAGIPVQVLEASDRPGGRVGSRAMGDFRCDLGFQVLLDAYPQVQDRVDLRALKLGRFSAGAKVYWRGKLHCMADPLRHPTASFAGLRGPGSFVDKMRLLRMARAHARLGVDEALAGENCSTLEWLQQQGMSEAMLQHFLRPWFGGILCDRELRASSRLFRAYYACLSRGAACLPAGGMQALADHLAAQLPADCIRYRQKVVAVQPRAVQTRYGQWPARAVVLACEAPTSAALLGEPAPPPGVGLRSLWWSSDTDPGIGPWLLLDGEGRGPVNHLAAPSQLADGYAPAGQHLMVATVLGEHCWYDDLHARVRQQLAQWLGPQVHSWQLLADQPIPYAQPRQWPEDLEQAQRPQRHASGCWVCGDQRDHGSINGALASGERCARDVLASMVVA